MLRHSETQTECVPTCAVLYVSVRAALVSINREQPNNNKKTAGLELALSHVLFTASFLEIF